MPKRGSPGTCWMMKYQPQSSVAFCGLSAPLAASRCHVEAEEANVWFDFGAEDREQNFRFHVRFRLHFDDHRLLCRIGRAVLVAKDVRALRVHDCVRIFLQQLAAHEQHELPTRRPLADCDAHRASSSEVHVSIGTMSL